MAWCLSISQIFYFKNEIIIVFPISHLFNKQLRILSLYFLTLCKVHQVAYGYLSEFTSYYSQQYYLQTYAPLCTLFKVNLLFPHSQPEQCTLILFSGFVFLSQVTWSGKPFRYKHYSLLFLNLYLIKQRIYKVFKLSII